MSRAYYEAVLPEGNRQIVGELVSVCIELVTLRRSISAGDDLTVAGVVDDDLRKGGLRFSPIADPVGTYERFIAPAITEIGEQLNYRCLLVARH